MYGKAQILTAFIKVKVMNGAASPTENGPPPQLPCLLRAQRISVGEGLPGAGARGGLGLTHQEGQAQPEPAL